MTRLTNLVLSIALIAAIAYTLGRESAEAQGRDGELRIAVVDFTTLGKSVEDVDRINNLMQRLRELGSVQEEYHALVLANVEKELAALREYGQEDTPDWERRMGEYQEGIADYESVKEVTRFKMQQTASVFSAKLLEKMLRAIRQCSANAYDVVFKVLGDADDKDREGENSLMNDAMKFNLNRAREILFHEPTSVHDITHRVAREIDIDRDVSDDLEEKIAKTNEEIAAVKKMIEEIK